jgi:lysophosphatidylcholine acyltransferase/lyso-PAF acetyltransferase
MPTGQPVQPVCVRYHNERYNPGWVTAGPSPVVLMLRVLCEPVNWMSVEYLPVMHPTMEEKADANVFARNVRAKMAATLGVATTEHSYEDITLGLEAVKNHVRPFFHQKYAFCPFAFSLVSS